MNAAIAIAAQLLHVALVLAAAPTLIGVIQWMQARMVGRQGPPLLQPWRELARLLRKQPVMAESASEVFVLAPMISAACVAIAAVLVPSFTLGMAFASRADLLTIAGLLALARCSTALAGMDVGSALGGLGASRTMAIGCLSDTALFLVIFSLGLLAGSSNLDLVAATQLESGMDWRAGVGIALVATVLMVVADGAAGPAPRSETTMQREAMALEFSGRDQALIQATDALRLLVWFSLIIAMFLPFGMAPAGAGLLAFLLGLACWLVKLLLLAAGLALLQTMIGRVRPMHVPQMLGIAILLGLLAALFFFASSGIA
jgi:formate hydrogenlyase subunit 4